MRGNAQKISMIQRILSLTENNDINSEINIGIDVDGTLTNEKIGQEIMSLGPDKAAKAMLDCTPKDGIEILFETDHNIYIITGRPKIYKNATMDWLDTYGIPYNDLTMFPNNFYAIHGYSIPKYIDLKLDIHMKKNIHVALDDNSEVISILNKFGIYSCQVNDNFRDAFERVLELKDRALQQHLEKNENLKNIKKEMR